MTVINKTKLISNLKKYINKNYDMQNIRIGRKFNHSCNVAQNAELIAERIGMNAESCSIAWMTGLLHDIGRFPQATKYDTFIDAVSLSHAEEGVKILFDENHIYDFFEKDELPKNSPQYLIIKDAILQHSSANIIPNSEISSLKNYEDPYWLHKVIRDADKIDIVKQYVEDPSFSCDMKDTGVPKSISEDILNSFLSQEIIRHKDLKNAADEYVLCASFLYFLNYPGSIKLMLEQHYIEHIFDYIELFEPKPEHYEKVKNYFMKYIQNLNQDN